MTRKTQILLALLLAFPALALGGGEEKKKDKFPVVPWQAYHPAMETGKVESKPIFLHFTNGRSGSSESMNRETYSNPKVARYLRENFATGWIDMEVYPALGKKYKVGTSLTLWFLDSSGRALTSVDGFLSAPKLMLVLEYIKTKAYQNISYEDWKDKRPRR